VTTPNPCHGCQWSRQTGGKDGGPYCAAPERYIHAIKAPACNQPPKEAK